LNQGAVHGEVAMTLNRNQGMVLLGIWLALTGLLPLLGIVIPFREPLMGLLALAAGAFILFEIRASRHLGMLILGVWLVLTGLSAFLMIAGIGNILGLLALAAGILILVGR
jgi:hypothetical protein